MFRSIIRITFFVIAYLLFYLAERVFLGSEANHLIWASCGFFVAVLAHVGIVYALADGQHRRALGQASTAYFLNLLGLGLYAALYRSDFISTTTLRDLANVVWPALSFSSSLVALFIEFAIASMELAPSLEIRRLHLARNAALSISFAFISFASINFAANALNRKYDLSYFKTTGVGTATRALLESAVEPVEIHAFFEAQNDVLRELSPYLEALNSASAQLEVSIVDHAQAPKLARELRVQRNGSVVLSSNGRNETVFIGKDLLEARRTMQVLDSKIYKSLSSLLHPLRIAYLSVGHDERDWSPTQGDRKRGLRLFKELLEQMGYEVRRLGLASGLGADVPKDATLLVVAGPNQAFSTQELESVERYLNRGGSLFWLLDETQDKANPEKLFTTLGLEIEDGLAADTKNRISRTSPHAFATFRVGAHKSVETLRRRNARDALTFLGAKTLRFSDNNNGNTIAKTHVVNLMESGWKDRNSNAKQDPDEVRGGEGLMVALEGSFSAQSTSAFRALVSGDVDMIADGVAARGNILVIEDSVRWLSHEESLAGEIEAEKDITIVHRREDDLLWFYGSTLATPMLILYVGYLISLKRRRRGGTR